MNKLVPYRDIPIFIGGAFLCFFIPNLLDSSILHNVFPNLPNHVTLVENLKISAVATLVVALGNTPSAALYLAMFMDQATDSKRLNLR